MANANEHHETIPTALDADASTMEHTPITTEVSDKASRPAVTDDFDRIGNEISLMLRQAQESASKIRGDAEVEARALVEQVKVDLEADRVAHNQAAAELVSRTEERANAMRVSAEESARKTVEDADQAAKNLEKEAASKIESANDESNRILAEARSRADVIVADAESEAKTSSDEILGRARTELQILVDAETQTRKQLDETRKSIGKALDQPSISQLETDSHLGNERAVEAS